jgi:hypothetical protein
VDADEYSQEKAGTDVSETFDLRDYAAGDSLKSIHWKLTGKYGHLIVKEAGLPVRHSLLILVETAVRHTDQPVSPVMRDAWAEILVSLCQALADQNIPYDVGWQDYAANMFFRARVDSMEEFLGVLEKLLCIQSRPDEVGCMEHYVRRFGEIGFDHVVYLSSHLPAGPETLAQQGHITAIVCSETKSAAGPEYGGNVSVIYCSPDDYERELYDITI